MGKRTGTAAGDRYDLMDLTGDKVYVAVDTEYADNRTLTVQCAVQIGKTVFVQVYWADGVPKPPDLEQIRIKILKVLRGKGKRVIIRPAKRLPRDLSPARVLNDLVAPHQRWPLVDKSECPTRKGKDRKYQLSKRLKVVIVGHHLPADILRMFGKGYTEKLLAPGANRVHLHQMKRVGFATQRQRPGSVVCEGIRWGEAVVPVTLDTFDTNLPFGKGKLGDLCKRFLGIDKCEIAPEDLRDMREYFKAKPAEAYEYAIRDVLLTLLLREKMNELDRQLLGQLGIQTDESHEVKRTVAGRACAALLRLIEGRASGSTVLARVNRPSGASGTGRCEISRQKLRERLQLGGANNLRERGLSKFGPQIGDVHGGLGNSRSSQQLYHEAPGQLADVDLKGCYPSVIKTISLYAGQPLVWEPGKSRLKLKDVVALMTTHAAGRDAWMVKVTGDVPSNDNVLIPSTRNALTLDNLRERKKRGKAKHSDADRDGKTTIYSKRIEAGVVCWSTWLVIQALPAPLRQEYENLTVDTVVFYPKKLVAETVQEFDDLVARYRSPDVGWEATLDFQSFDTVETRTVTEDHVSLKLPLKSVMERLITLREEVRKKPDGDLLQKEFKEYANILYGIIASPHYCTGNVVAANVITATARAAAFLLQLSLNGFQVITDGCIYRRDEIPAVTFAELLRSCPGYCRHRPAAGSFAAIEPETIPSADADFTTWYRNHARGFFELSGDEYDDLLNIHQLEHKPAGKDKEPRFDALCCDGSSNYVKLAIRDGKHVVLDFKARQYRDSAKQALQEWLVPVCATDTYTPSPLCASERLLSLAEARRKAKKVLDEESAKDPASRVLFPLAFPDIYYCHYRIIKLSAFTFQTPAQERYFRKAVEKFQARHGAGLEALALRRHGKGRHPRSFQWVARKIFELIENGETNPVKGLNLNRKVNHYQLTDAVAELERKKGEHQRQFRAGILLDPEQQEELDTGWFVGLQDLA